MYDIRIFIEEDWTFGWRIKAGKETIYWVWKNHDELLQSLRDWLDLAFQERRITSNTNRLISFLSSSKKETICR